MNLEELLNEMFGTDCTCEKCKTKNKCDTKKCVRCGTELNNKKK